jgi:hypothetical protein
MLLLVLVSARTGWGAQGGASPVAPPATVTSPSVVPDDPNNRTGNILEDQAKLRNVQRQKQIVDDTQRLLGLANELKQDVDKSSKDTLSLDVIRKADEIEKLAHSVKERMKGE